MDQVESFVFAIIKKIRSFDKIKFITIYQDAKIMSLQFFIDWKLFLVDHRDIFKNRFSSFQRKACSSFSSPRHSSIPDISLHVSSTNVPPSFGIIKRHTGVILLEKIIPLQNFLVRGMHNRDTIPINDETRWNFSTRSPTNVSPFRRPFYSFRNFRLWSISSTFEFLGSLTNNLLFKMKQQLCIFRVIEKK